MFSGKLVVSNINIKLIDCSRSLSGLFVCLVDLARQYSISLCVFYQPQPALLCDTEKHETEIQLVLVIMFDKSTFTIVQVQFYGT